jgi:hypothetical protein
MGEGAPVGGLRVLQSQHSCEQGDWLLDVSRAEKDIYNMDWKPGPEQAEKGKLLAAQYNIRGVRELTSCSTCHR